MYFHKSDFFNHFHREHFWSNHFICRAKAIHIVLFSLMISDTNQEFTAWWKFVTLRATFPILLHSFDENRSTETIILICMNNYFYFDTLYTFFTSTNERTKRLVIFCKSSSCLKKIISLTWAQLSSVWNYHLWNQQMQHNTDFYEQHHWWFIYKSISQPGFHKKSWNE